MQEILRNYQTLFTNDLKNITSNVLNEKDENVSSAFITALPYLLHSLLEKRFSNHDKIVAFLDNGIKVSFNYSSFISDIKNQNENSIALNNGLKISELALGTKSKSVFNILSNQCGISQKSSEVIFIIISSLLPHFIQQFFINDKNNINSFFDSLKNSHDVIKNSINPLFLKIGEEKNSTSKPLYDKINPKKEQEEKNKFIFPLVFLVLFIIGIFWWQKGCNLNNDKESNQKIVIDSTENNPDKVLDNNSNNLDSINDENLPIAGAGRIDSNGNWIVVKGDSSELKLESGVMIQTFMNSTEEQLYHFIMEPSAVVDKNLWFNFDDLYFESGKSKLLKGYEHQLDNICEILKSYPKVKIKIGAYTDNTGDSLANMKLSNERAKKVYELMLQRKVDKSSFDDKPYEGYGSQHPIETNDTEEGRAQNRRVAISVRAK